MFEFLSTKSAAQRKSEAGAVEAVRRAQAVWSNADLSKRTSLLSKVIDTQDDRVFLAYVHSQWSQIPYDDRMKLTLQVMKYEDNERVARRAGQIVAEGFDAENFNKAFAQMPLAPNWTSDDALGVWYSLGRFCFLISIGSIQGFEEHEIDNIIESGQASMMNTWRMSKDVRDRFERFNDDRLASVFSTYTSLSSPEAFRAFFTFFVSEILGTEASFTPSDASASLLDRLLQGQGLDSDPCLISKVSSMFSYMQKAIHDYVSKFWD